MKVINTPEEAAKTLGIKPRKREPRKGEGRPSKKKDFDIRMIYEMAGCGLTEKQIANVLGISIETIAKWKQSDPEFLHTLKTAKQRFDQEVVKSLKHRATGYSHIDTICFQHKGKIITKEVMKHYPPDPTSMIFWLKNRDKESWRDKVEMDHGITDESYEKYKNMTVAELKKKVEEILIGS